MVTHPAKSDFRSYEIQCFQHTNVVCILLTHTRWSAKSSSIVVFHIGNNREFTCLQHLDDNNSLPHLFTMFLKCPIDQSSKYVKQSFLTNLQYQTQGAVLHILGTNRSIFTYHFWFNTFFVSFSVWAIEGHFFAYISEIWPKNGDFENF